MSEEVRQLQPLRGLQTVHDSEVMLVIEEAFDDPPTFQEVALRLQTTPDALLKELCTKHADREARVTRHLFRLSVLNELLPGYPDAFGHVYVEEEIDVVIDVWKRRYEDERSVAAPYKTVWPDWPVPKTDVFGNQLVLVTRLDDSVQKVVIAPDPDLDAAHAWLAEQGVDLEELRKSCAAISKHARKAVRYAAKCRYALDSAGIKELNDIATVLATMLAFTEEYKLRDTKPPYVITVEEQLRRVRLRLADVTLLSGLLSRWHLGNTSNAEQRDKALGKMAKALANLPQEAAQELLRLDTAAPTDVWVAYHEAMVNAASAIAVAPERYARPLLEKHFVHVFRAVLEQSSFPLNTSSMSSAAAQAWAENVRDFNPQCLAPLDNAAKPAFIALSVGPTDIKQFFDAGLKPITYYETVVSTLSKLAPTLGVILSDGPDAGDAVSAFMMRTLLALSGTAHDLEVEKLMVEIVLHHDYFRADQAVAHVRRFHARHAIKGVKAPAERFEKRMNSGLILPGLRALAELAGTTQELFETLDQPEVHTSDMIKVLQSAKGTAETIAAPIVARYETMWKELPEKKLVGGLTGQQALQIKSLAEKGSAVVGIALGVWRVAAIKAEKEKWAQDWWKGEGSQEVLGVVLSTVGLFAPTAAFALGLVVGLSAALGKGAKGPGPGTRRYCERQWATVLAKIQTISKVVGVDVKADDFDYDDAYDDTEPLAKRIRALAMRIEGGEVRDPPTEADRKQVRYWRLGIGVVGEARVRRAVANEGFAPEDIDLLFKL